MTRPGEPDPRRTVVPAASPPIQWIVTGFLPIGLFIVLMIVAPRFVSVLGDNPPALLGLPLGYVLMGIALAWSAIGLLLIVGAESRGLRLVAMAAFTLPALWLVIFAPAVVIIAKTLGTT